MIRICRLDVACVHQFLLAQRGRRVHVGGDLLAKRLHTLTVQRVLPALGRLLQLACRQPLALRADLGVQRHQIGPQAPSFLPERLT